MILIGLVCPFGEPARIEKDQRLGKFNEQFECGCFDALLRGTRVVPVWISHDARHVIANECDLWTTYAGLYARITVLPRAERLVREYAYDAERWGRRMRASVNFLDDDLDDHWSAPPRRVRMITRVARLREVSLSVHPAYASTWIAYNTPEARQRIVREELNAAQKEIEALRAAV